MSNGGASPARSATHRTNSVSAGSTGSRGVFCRRIAGAIRRRAGRRVFFLPRQGRGHPLPPSAINFRANIDELKRCGVTDIVSLSAVGSLREDLVPGDFVVTDQFI